MTSGDVLKLLALLLIAGVVFAAGFRLGQNREQRVWQDTAVRFGSGRWTSDPQTGEPAFEWLPPSERRTAKQ